MKDKQEKLDEKIFNDLIKRHNKALISINIPKTKKNERKLKLAN